MTIATDSAATPHSDTLRAIRVRGAAENNLQHVDLDLPHGQLIVLTGPSGSGKSSLAVDTIFAEGQRQYLETLSWRSRQWLNPLPHPRVDKIEGLQPTLCLDQRPPSRDRRRTVGTATDLLNYLQVLMARVADLHCLTCGQRIRQMSEAQIAAWVQQLPAGTKAMILAPLTRGSPAERPQAAEALNNVRTAGLIRARINGSIHDLDPEPEWDAGDTFDVDAVVDRIVVRDGIESRLIESIGLAAKLANGTVVISFAKRAGGEPSTQPEWVDQRWTTRFGCPDCDENLPPIEPETFSFNSASGACPDCQGLGLYEQFDLDRVLDPSVPIDSGAVLPWSPLTGSAHQQRLKQLDPFFARYPELRLQKLDQWPDEQRDLFLSGDGQQWPGLAILLEKEWATATAPGTLQRLDRFRYGRDCPNCHGTRLSPLTDCARLGPSTLRDLLQMPIDELLSFFQQLSLTTQQQTIGRHALPETIRRLQFLVEVGLGYLTLARSADSLSGGEYQRVRLSSSLGAGLGGVCYILDEPTVGLHSRDTDRILQSIRRLQQFGSTVLVVEHDESFLRAADQVVEFGPGAGEQGGRIVCQGTPDDIARSQHSLTGSYLRYERRIERDVGRPAADIHPGYEPGPPGAETTDDKRTADDKPTVMRFEGVTIHSLVDLTVEIPLGRLVAITGVSGSGKSTLLDQVVAPNLNRHLRSRPNRDPVGCRAVSIPPELRRAVRVDQSMMGQSPHSNVATYTGVFDEIRHVFAATPLARQLGYTRRRFSFNQAAGQCPDCRGTGEQRIAIKFLPDFIARCETCRGRRYNRQTLQVRYRGRSIADILDLSIKSARDFFQNFAKITRVLDPLIDIGLGYLTLGQPATQLSGGEAQRVKLATELAESIEQGQTVYLLDEPTTGLHYNDVQRLLDVLVAIVHRGHTVVVIEHHLDMVRAADWIIDMGPEGGPGGGQIVATGTPDQVLQNEHSHTGQCLRHRSDELGC